MHNKDYFHGLSNILIKDSIGNKLMREFSNSADVDFYDLNDEDDGYNGIRGGVYYNTFARFAVYLENKYGITSVSLIQTIYVYEFLAYMKLEGFKDSTLKGYITAIRQVYQEQKHLFSNEFILPTNAEYEKYMLNNR